MNVVSNAPTSLLLSSSSSSSNEVMVDDDWVITKTYKEFLRALRSPEPFHPFVWIFRLLQAVGMDILCVTGVQAVCHRYPLFGKAWRPLIPLLAIGLILLIVFSYYVSLRQIVMDEWCEALPCNKDMDKEDENDTEMENCSCRWIYVHDGIVGYVVSMILFHLFRTIFQSPGVSLKEDMISEQQATGKNYWSSMESQGGILGINAKLDVKAERKRVELYSTSHIEKMNNNNNNNHHSMSLATENQNIDYFPDPYPSFCKQCQTIRPPRCHHCRICKRCVLQFDHHCVWLNNCIGLNNYQSFLLLLFHISIGCWYGVILLFRSFWEPIRNRVQEQGLHWMYSNGTGFLNLPPLRELVSMICTGTVPTKMVLDLVVPFLLCMGFVLTAFLLSHVRYILMARTSLEHKVMTEQQLMEMLQTSSRDRRKTTTTTNTTATTTTMSNHHHKSTVNPFNQGPYKNWQQIMGPIYELPILLLLPIPLATPTPYVPNMKKNR